MRRRKQYHVPLGPHPKIKDKIEINQTITQIRADKKLSGCTLNAQNSLILKLASTQISTAAPQRQLGKWNFKSFPKWQNEGFFFLQTVLAVLPFPTIIWQFAFPLFYFFSFGCSRTSEVSLQDVYFEAALVLHSHWSNGPYGCHVIWHLSWQASKRGN